LLTRVFYYDTMAFVDRSGRACKRIACLVLRRDWFEEVFLMYAIIATGGKQYRVQEGDLLFVEKLTAEADSTVEINEVLAVSKDGKLTVGSPVVDGAKVTATVVKHGKAKKILVFKYKRKKDYRRKQGHRQPYTQIKIEKIEA
jgi:large subunit ribosomal protein L21